MKTISIDPDRLAALAALADGIIPADETDAGAGEVQAARTIADRIESGVNASLYLGGLELAADLARITFGSTIPALSPQQVHELLALIQAQKPAFFKQLRMDVCVLYLADPAVCNRIGFPGPSSETGGHPDFALPQAKVHGGRDMTQPASPALISPEARSTGVSAEARRPPSHPSPGRG